MPHRPHRWHFLQATHLVHSNSSLSNFLDTTNGESIVERRSDLFTLRTKRVPLGFKHPARTQSKWWSWTCTSQLQLGECLRRICPVSRGREIVARQNFLPVWESKSPWEDPMLVPKVLTAFFNYNEIPTLGGWAVPWDEALFGNNGGKLLQLRILTKHARGVICT
jgi:hypothetical protein